MGPTTDSVGQIAAGYGAAFPQADAADFEAHLAVTRSGAALQQAVARFLSANFDINPARYSLLRALYFAEGKRLPQSDVARTLNVTSPNVTQLIDALERDGLVERVVAETDRRVSYAKLTPLGESRCGALVPAMASFMIETVRGLSADDKADLVRILGLLRDQVASLPLGELPSKTA